MVLLGLENGMLNDHAPEDYFTGNEPLVCPNADCSNRGQYVNCYSGNVDDCFHYILWERMEAKHD